MQSFTLIFDIVVDREALSTSPDWLLYKDTVLRKIQRRTIEGTRTVLLLVGAKIVGQISPKRDS